jgi:uncharacterized protein
MPALLAAVVALAAATTPAATPPAPTRWVEDRAGLMSEPARAALDVRLEAYQQATGHQVVVWIGKTLGGAPLDDWAVRTFAAWKVGQAKLDDGVAIFVLAEDRAIDIEVGYGLEDKVPDAVASRIIREVMAPKLRASDPDGAITAGTNAVLAAIEGHPWQGGGVPTGAGGPPSTLTWILGGLAGLAFLILLVVSPRSVLWILWIVARSAGSGGFGGGGGGGGGGGFGGGGGRSGGGGGRGSW